MKFLYLALACVVIAGCSTKFEPSGKAGTVQGTTNSPKSAVTSAWVKASHGLTEGQGHLLAGRDGCVILTAAHVIGDADTVIVAFPDLPRTESRPTFVDERNDIALIGPEGIAQSVCPAVSSSSQIRASLSEVGEIWVTSEAGAVNLHPVRVARIEERSIYLRSATGRDNLAPGSSGAPVVFGGAVIGTFLERRQISGESLLYALRADYIGRVLSGRLSQVSELGDTNKAFDENQLPAKVKEVVIEARRVRKLAEAAAKAGRQVEREVDLSAAKARASGRMAYYDDGHADFIGRDGHRRFTGQVRLNDQDVISAEGLVMSETLKGRFVGNVTKCARTINGCTGRGAYYYALNEANTGELQVYYGDLGNNDLNYIIYGFGHYIFRNGDQAFLDYRPDSYPTPGVFVEKDGKRYEGMGGKSGATAWNREGVGVLWNRDGSVDRYGVWAEEVLIVDWTQ